MDLETIAAILTTFETDQSLEIETNLIRRLNVLDLIDLAERHSRPFTRRADLTPIQQRLADFKTKLLTINANVFDRLRTQIRAGTITPETLRHEFKRYTNYAPERKNPPHLGHDALDALVDGILQLEPYPHYMPASNPDMIPYQPTPARAVLELMDKVNLRPADVVYDLGSGMGRVVIAAHLISGARAKGVEFNPDLHRYASGCAQNLGLTRVEFINADAQTIDYSDGTVFFMYAPFTGALMQAVLDRLRQTAQQHPIRICALGPCTSMIVDQKWLSSEAEDVYDVNSIIVFSSRANQ
jgi:hypothetical protein